MKYKLKELLVDKGYIRGPFGSALKRGELLSEGIPVYEQQNVINNHRNFRFFISEDKYEQLKRFTVQPNDILISCSGTVGKVTIIKDEDPMGIISQALLILRPDTTKVLPEFLYYFFSSSKGYNSIVSRSSGSVQVNIAKRKVIEEIEIEVPNLNIQSKIVNILKVLDGKIEINNKINNILEEIAQTIFKHWFVDFEFPNEKGEPYKSSGGKLVESELGMIPEGFTIGNFANLVTIKYGKDHRKLKEGNIPVYGSGGIIRYVDKALYTGESVLIPRKGTLNNIVYINKPFWTADTMFYTMMNKKNIAKFVYYFIKSKDLISMNTGSAVPSMTVKTLSNINVVIPSPNILKKFEEVISPFFIKMNYKEEENKILTNIRDTLLPKLMSGEIRVPEAEEVVENYV